MHEAEIILFEASREALGKPITREMLSSVFILQDTLSDLERDLASLEKDYQKQKAKTNNINDLKSNFEIYFSNSKAFQITK